MNQELEIRHTIAHSDGNSEFVKEKVKLNDDPNGGQISDPIPIKGIFFRTVVPSRDKDLELPHKAPADQYVIQLKGGGIRVGTSVGQSTDLFPPTIGRVSDTTGIGHSSVPLSDEPRTSLFVPFANPIS